MHRNYILDIEVRQDELVVIEQTDTSVMYLQEINTEEKNLDGFRLLLDPLTEKNGSY